MEIVQKSNCANILFSKVFGSKEMGIIDDGTPWEETAEWLDQYFPCKREGKIYLLVGTESFPLEIWGTNVNRIDSECELIWSNEK